MRDENRNRGGEGKARGRETERPARPDENQAQRGLGSQDRGWDRVREEARRFVGGGNERWRYEGSRADEGREELARGMGPNERWRYKGMRDEEMRYGRGGGDERGRLEGMRDEPGRYGRGFESYGGRYGREGGMPSGSERFAIGPGYGEGRELAYGMNRGEAGGPYRGKGPRNYRRSDERIREDIHDHLTFQDELDASDIEVLVKDGEVTLRGMVAQRHEKRAAEDLAERVRGVTDVRNEIRVRREEERIEAGGNGSHRAQGGTEKPGTQPGNR